MILAKLLECMTHRLREAKKRNLLLQVQRNVDIREKGPHINIDSIAVPRSKLNQSQHVREKSSSSISKYNAARDFGLKSLYKNDVTKQY